MNTKRNKMFIFLPIILFVMMFISNTNATSVATSVATVNHVIFLNNTIFFNNSKTWYATNLATFKTIKESPNISGVANFSSYNITYYTNGTINTSLISLLFYKNLGSKYISYEDGYELSNVDYFNANNIFNNVTLRRLAEKGKFSISVNSSLNTSVFVVDNFTNKTINGSNTNGFYEIENINGSSKNYFISNPYTKNSSSYSGITWNFYDYGNSSFPSTAIIKAKNGNINYYTLTLVSLQSTVSEYGVIASRTSGVTIYMFNGTRLIANFTPRITPYSQGVEEISSLQINASQAFTKFYHGKFYIIYHSTAYIYNVSFTNKTLTFYKETPLAFISQPINSTASSNKSHGQPITLTANSLNITQNKPVKITVVSNSLGFNESMLYTPQTSNTFTLNIEAQPLNNYLYGISNGDGSFINLIKSGTYNIYIDTADPTLNVTVPSNPANVSVSNSIVYYGSPLTIYGTANESYGCLLISAPNTTSSTCYPNTTFYGSIKYKPFEFLRLFNKNSTLNAGNYTIRVKNLEFNITSNPVNLTILKANYSNVTINNYENDGSEFTGTPFNLTGSYLSQGNNNNKYPYNQKLFINGNLSINNIKSNQETTMSFISTNNYPKLNSNNIYYMPYTFYNSKYSSYLIYNQNFSWLGVISYSPINNKSFNFMFPNNYTINALENNFVEGNNMLYSSNNYTNSNTIIINQNLTTGTENSVYMNFGRYGQNMLIDYQNGLYYTMEFSGNYISISTLNSSGNVINTVNSTILLNFNQAYIINGTKQNNLFQYQFGGNGQIGFVTNNGTTMYLNVIYSDDYNGSAKYNIEINRIYEINLTTGNVIDSYIISPYSSGINTFNNSTLSLSQINSFQIMPTFVKNFTVVESNNDSLSFYLMNDTKMSLFGNILFPASLYATYPVFITNNQSIYTLLQPSNTTNTYLLKAGMNYSATTSVLNAGTYNIKYDVSGNNNYNNASVSEEFEIYKAHEEISFSVNNCNNNETYINAMNNCSIGINRKVMSNYDIPNATVYLNGNAIYKSDSTSFTLSNNYLVAGQDNFVANTLGNNNYLPASATYNITIKKSSISTALSFIGYINTAQNIYSYNPDAEVQLTESYYNNVNSKVILNNKTYSFNSNGELDFIGLSAGNYTMKVIVSNNTDFNNYSKTYTFTITKFKSSANINYLAGKYDGYNYFEFSMNEGQLANFTINNETYNSISSIDLQHLSAGNYNWSLVTIPNDNFTQTNVTGNFNISKIHASIDIPSGVTIYNGQTQEFPYSISSYNNQISNTIVLVNENVIARNITSGDIGLKYPNVYNITIIAYGNRNYTNTTDTSKITINKQTVAYEISNVNLVENLTKPNYVNISTTVNNALNTKVYENGNYIGSFINNISISKNLNKTGTYNISLIGTPINSSLTNPTSFNFTVNVKALSSANFSVSCPSTTLQFGNYCNVDVLSFNYSQPYISIINKNTNAIIENITSLGVSRLPYSSIGNYSYELNGLNEIKDINFSVVKGNLTYEFYYSSQKLTNGQNVKITSNVVNLGTLNFTDFPINITAVVESENFSVKPILYYNGKNVTTISNINIAGIDYSTTQFSIGLNNYHSGLNIVNFTSTENSNYNMIDPELEFNVQNANAIYNNTIKYQNNTYNNSYFKIYIPYIPKEFTTNIYYNYTPANALNKTSLVPQNMPKKNVTYLMNNLTYTYLTKSNETPTVEYNYTKANAGIYVFKAVITNGTKTFDRLFYETYYRAIPFLTNDLSSVSQNYTYGQKIAFYYSGNGVFYKNSTNLSDGTANIYGNTTMLTAKIDNITIGQFAINKTFSATLFDNDDIQTSQGRNFFIKYNKSDLGKNIISIVAENNRNITYASVNKTFYVSKPTLVLLPDTNYNNNLNYVLGYQTNDNVNLYEAYNPDKLSLYINNELALNGTDLNYDFNSNYTVNGITYNILSNLNYPFEKAYYIQVKGIDDYLNLIKNATISVYKPYIYSGKIKNYSVNSTLYNGKEIVVSFFNNTAQKYENGTLNGLVSIKYGNTADFNSTQLNVISLPSETELYKGSFSWKSDGYFGIYNITNTKLISGQIHGILITYGNTTPVYQKPANTSVTGYINYYGSNDGVYYFNGNFTGKNSTISKNSTSPNINGANPDSSISCKSLNEAGKIIYDCKISSTQPNIDLVFDGKTFNINSSGVSSTSSDYSFVYHNAETGKTTVETNTYSPTSSSSSHTTKKIGISNISISNILNILIPNITKTNAINKTFITKTKISKSSSVNINGSEFKPQIITSTSTKITKNEYCIMNNCISANTFDLINTIIIVSSIAVLAELIYYLTKRNKYMNKNKY
jgi:hypothetical protein